MKLGQVLIMGLAFSSMSALAGFAPVTGTSGGSASSTFSVGVPPVVSVSGVGGGVGGGTTGGARAGGGRSSGGGSSDSSAGGGDSSAGGDGGDGSGDGGGGE